MTYQYAPGLTYDLAQYSKETRFPGHHLTLVPEEPAPDSGTSHGAIVGRPVYSDTAGKLFIPVEETRGYWPVPWLRANCSCGWRAPRNKRFTIEFNAIAYWHKHLDRVGAKTAEG